MIFSGTLTLDPASHAASTSTLRTRLSDLESRRQSARTAVELVLETWHGEAADRFLVHWQEWDRGARVLGEQLAAGIDALDRVRADVVGVDRVRGAASTHLAGRLG